MQSGLEVGQVDDVDCKVAMGLDYIEQSLDQGQLKEALRLANILNTKGSRPSTELKSWISDAELRLAKEENLQLL